MVFEVEAYFNTRKTCYIYFVFADAATLATDWKANNNYSTKMELYVY